MNEMTVYELLVTAENRVRSLENIILVIREILMREDSSCADDWQDIADLLDNNGFRSDREPELYEG